MELSLDHFDKFVGVLARFTVTSFVAHLTAPEGRVTNEQGAEVIEKMLGEAKLPQELKGLRESHALLRFGGKDRFAVVWDMQLKLACAPLPPEMQVTVIERFTAAKAWRQAVY